MLLKPRGFVDINAAWLQRIEPSNKKVERDRFCIIILPIGGHGICSRVALRYHWKRHAPIKPAYDDSISSDGASPGSSSLRVAVLRHAGPVLLDRHGAPGRFAIRRGAGAAVAHGGIA